MSEAVPSTQSPVVNRRLKRCCITGELLFHLFQNGEHNSPRYRVSNGFPLDARLINVKHGWPHLVELLVASVEFDEVPDGQVIPELTPVVEHIS